ncbi:hypothetical protein E4T50_09691 [Aureobasidium sp. EXF-12298]|nr:hypothetical protein E4T50_09691 [Aureobasidium sp. EXF-12298]
MDTLPLEMKQRICSFLHASPKLLKPIRLVSKQFAAAAAPYLIPRAFLFNHPDSCDEVQKILQHPVFSKYVTTLAVDVSKLKYPTVFEQWVDHHENMRLMYPDWWDFKPGAISYDHDGDPLLTDHEDRTSWMKATKDFNQALMDTTQSLQEVYHKCWTTQMYLAAHVQLDLRFKTQFWDTLAKAFETIFRACLATKESFVQPASHVPPELGLREVMQATKKSKLGLDSLTIVDFPINFADFSMITGLRSVENLKHIRIGYNRLRCDPKTGFDFNLEKVLQAAQLLQTFWAEMPPRRAGQYDAGDLLRAINSKHFRDILLHNAIVSEESMVSFLLRHTESLQQLDLGVTLSPGTWFSTFQRVSKQMSMLKRIQLVGIREFQAAEEVMFSSKWCLEAQDFLIKGGELSQPEAYDLSTHFEDDIEMPLRNEDVPENGLWSDYDAESNTCF